MRGFASATRLLGRVRPDVFAGLALIAACLPTCASYFIDMARNSLWSDELMTLEFFVSKGPLRVLTDYSSTNNHIFFNFLTALPPAVGLSEHGLHDPLRARVVSFIAVAAGLTLLVAWLWRRAAPYAAGAAFLLLAGAVNLLSLNLQARGYGLAFFFAIAASLCVLERVRTGRATPLALLVVCCALGGWTMPGLLFFGGPCLLLLFAQERSRAAFFAGGATVGLVLLLYAPVLPELYRRSVEFETVIGREFDSWRAVTALLLQFLYPFFGSQEWWALLFLGCSLAAPFLLRKDERDALGLRLLSLSLIAFLGICLTLRTPPLRTVAYGLAPLALVFSLSCQRLLDRVSGWPRWAACGLAPLAALGYLALIDGDRCLPVENWKELGETVEHAVPPEVALNVNYMENYLRPYLDPARRLDEPDARAFQEGRLAQADTNFFYNESFDPSRIAPESVVLRFAQARARGFMQLAFAPVWETRVESAIEEQGGLRVALAGGEYRSFVLYCPQGPAAGELRASWRGRPVVASRVGGLLVLDLRDAGGKGGNELLLRVEPGRSLRPLAMWGVARR